MSKKKGHDEIYYLGYVDVSKDVLGEPYPQHVKLKDIKLPKRVMDRMDNRIKDYDDALEYLNRAYNFLHGVVESFKTQVGERNLMFGKDGGFSRESDPRGDSESTVITDMDEHQDWIASELGTLGMMIEELEEVKKDRTYRRLYEPLAVKKMLRFHPESIYNDEGDFVGYRRRKSK